MDPKNEVEDQEEQLGLGLEEQHVQDDSQSEFQIKELKRQISSLKAQLEEQESEAQLAAKLGQQLLEENSKLNEIIEEERNRYTSKIEELTQDNYSLKSKITTTSNLLDIHNQEIESIKDQEKKKFENEKKHLESVYEKKFNDTKRAKESLEADISQFTLREKQLEEKVQLLQEIIEELKKTPKVVDMNVTLEGENHSLKKTLAEVSEENDLLNGVIRDLKNEIERHVLENANMKKTISSLKAEQEVDQQQGTMWFNNLQDARAEITELNIKLSQLETELEGRGHSKKGNSLFSEVEDQRIEAEKKLCSLTERYDSMSRAYALAKQEIHRMKTQVLALLQMRGGRADSTRIHQLEEALSQARGEVQMLSVKLKRFEDKEATSDPLRQVKEYLQAFPGSEAQKDYVEFLLRQTEEFKDSSASLKKELQTARFVQIAQADKLRETEDKLYSATEIADKLKNENLKLRLAIEELKNKLEIEIRKRKESESKLESRFLENMKSNNFESKPQLPPTLLKNTAKKFGNQTKADNNQPPPAETEKKQKRGEVPAELKIKSSDSPRTKRIKLLKRLPKEIADSYLNEETDAKTKILSPVNVTTKDNEIPLSKEVKTTNPKREKKVSFKTSPVKHSVLQESVFDEVFEDSKLEQGSADAKGLWNGSTKGKVVKVDEQQNALSECKQQ